MENKFSTIEQLVSKLAEVASQSKVNIKLRCEDVSVEISGVEAPKAFPEPIMPYWPQGGGAPYMQVPHAGMPFPLNNMHPNMAQSANPNQGFTNYQGSPSQYQVPHPTQHSAQHPQENPTASLDLSNAVLSPMVGTVYLSSQPGEPSFISEGDKIDVGQSLLIIEAMKVMNYIKAERTGYVKKILIKDNEQVEYGTPLLIIED